MSAPAIGNRRLSPHFRLSEFLASPTARARGIENRPTEAHLRNLYQLAAWMEWVRAIFGRPITITSGYRSAALNRAVGGSATSDHLTGLAADFRVAGMGPEEAARTIASSAIPFDQLIFYPGAHVHLGFRPEPRGQILTSRNGRTTQGINP